MRQQVTWEETKGDSVNGYGIQIHYTLTSFDKSEIEYMKEWCEKRIKSGLISEHITGFILSTEDT